MFIGIVHKRYLYNPTLVDWLSLTHFAGCGWHENREFNRVRCDLDCDLPSGQWVRSSVLNKQGDCENWIQGFINDIYIYQYNLCIN